MILGNVLNIETFIDLGLDPGSANTLMCIKDQGIVVNEPTIVAVESESGELLAFGHDALNMHQKMHPGIQTIMPISKGIIGDYENVQKLFRELLHHVKPRILFGIHRLVISIPYGITEVGKRAFFDMAEHLGAKEAYLVLEPIAAAIGAGINPFEPVASLIVNLGAGTTQITVISLGGVVSGESLSISGNQINNAIIESLREKNNLAISEYAAEHIKLNITTTDRPDRESRLTVKGFNLLTGFPDTQEVSTVELREIITTSLQEVVTAIKKCIEVLADKPDVAVDILERGIYLTGGGALLAGIDKKIQSETGLNVTICEEPQTTVSKGLCTILNNFELYRPVLIDNKKKHKP
ncbi:cell shape determining protein MreB/Mrl [Chlorobaculum parvum NCIB 8327]|uniref:Cell shape-determining protein MreB n=2 Tax=Chlorobaculum parvum TaxID=274539 RepID=B3QPV4_CHLP8|nr:cell shape determining protein MreB/Mrl [Chlorobaculum parvum NCIB 8327]